MIEQRGGKHYYYRYEKVDGRSRRIYMGSGAEAEQAAAEDARLRAERAAEAAEWADTRRRLDAVDNALGELDKVVRFATRLVFLSEGYHQHDRGTWRKRRRSR
jgi:hypothetical protein